MEAEKQTVGVPTSPYKKSKKKLVIGAVIGTFLIASIVLGTITNFFGMVVPSEYQIVETNLDLDTDDIPGNDAGMATVVVSSTLKVTGVKLSDDGTKFLGVFCAKGTSGTEKVTAIFKANNYEDESTLTAPVHDSCTTVDSEDISKFSAEAGKDISVTFTIKFEALDEADLSDNKKTETISIPSETTDDGTDQTDEQAATTLDFYFDSNEQNSIGIEGDFFYAYFCSTSAQNETIEISYDINGKVKTFDKKLAGNNQCTKTSAAISYFELSTGVEYTFEAKVDKDNKFTEETEDNNKGTYKFTLPSDEQETTATDNTGDDTSTNDETATKDIYIGTTTGIGLEAGDNSFYAEVCGTGTDGTESIYIKYNANNKNNSLGFTAPSDGNCTVIQSWGLENFSIANDTTYTLTVTVDSTQLITETDEDNNTTSTEITKTEETETASETENAWLKKYTVIMMRIGDLEGIKETDPTTDYTGTLASDTLFIKPIESVLFEEGDDEYKSSDSGLEWSDKIYDHWDGIIFLAYYDQTHANGATPSFTVNVDGKLDQTIDSIEDLAQVYALNDQTDNEVDFIIIKDYSELPETFQEEGDIDENDNPEVVAENIQDLFTDRFSTMTKTLETIDVSEGTDTDTADAVFDLVETIVEVAVNENLTSDDVEETAQATADSIEAETADGDEVTAETVAAVEEDTNAAATDDYDAGFADVPNGAWYEDFVNSAEFYGVVNGYENGNFGPNDYVTRAALVKMVINAFEYDLMTDIAYNTYFSDLSTDAWYTDYINTAAYYELINGYSNGTFGPNNTVNRAEALKTIIEASGVEDKGRPEIGTEDTWINPFSDVDTYDWYYTYVMEGYSAGIISGNTGTFRPADPLTRAEACKIIVELMELLATPTM